MTGEAGKFLPGATGKILPIAGLKQREFPIQVRRQALESDLLG